MINENQSVHVLIVEDEPLIALQLSELLANMGFDDIECVQTLALGRNALAQHLPGLAILDINLGHELVFPLAEELRERGVPIVFSTGRTRRELPAEWRDFQLAAKPVDATELARAVAGLGFARYGEARP